MVSVDPQNYFTLIDPSESIFQKVRDRYQQKQIQWAASNSVELGGNVELHGGVISVKNVNK